MNTKERSAAWRLANPERNQRNLRKRRLAKYGLTPEDYEGYLVAQGFSCAICGVHASELKESLHVDHDHKCCPGNESCGQCVRGLLCRNCNLAIGNLQDDPEIVQAALRYLTNVN